LRDVKSGTDSVAGSYARRYAEEHGATIMLTALDREPSTPRTRRGGISPAPA